MSRRQRLCLFLCGLILVAGSAAAQSATRPGYDVAYIGPPLSDPVMQHAKETYVLFGCAYCHGVTLTPRGEAADLMHSALVGADTDGTAIAALLRAGIPQTAKLSPMPQFSDLSDQQLHDIARYIHYARQQGRYKELTEAKGAPGNPAAGRTYFTQACGACHSTDRDFARIGGKYDPAVLRAQILDPTSLKAEPSFKVDRLHDTRMASARDRHHSLLENCSAADVANVAAYLQTLK